VTCDQIKKLTDNYGYIFVVHYIYRGRLRLVTWLLQRNATGNYFKQLR